MNGQEVYPNDIFCQHARLHAHCEDCRFAAAAERGHRHPDHPQAEPRPDEQLAEHDLFIENGNPGETVFIAAGDPIPHHLAPG